MSLFSIELGLLSLRGLRAGTGEPGTGVRTGSGELAAGAGVRTGSGELAVGARGELGGEASWALTGSS